MDDRIFVALDANPAIAHTILKQLNPKYCGIKVGKELFTYLGPAIVRQCHDLGFKVFLDLKFCDIPNTVAKACKAVQSLGVYMTTVHAFGGKKMLQAAKNSVSETSSSIKTKILAVTLLTSISQTELNELGIKDTTQDFALKMAKLAKSCELDGVICSAKEVKLLRSNLGSNFLLVTPGIRPSNTTTDDQERVTTPLEAIQIGSDHLVIGRPITQANDPEQALKDIYDEITLQSKSSIPIT